MLNKAVINLNTLRDNAKKIKKTLNDNTLLNAVVKADAYGHGAEAISNALYDIVDSFSVALPEEGVRLRLAGIDKDILCFSPCGECDAEMSIRYNLTLTVTKVEHIKILDYFAKGQSKKVKVHIKYNTGMNRQGVDGLKNLKLLLQEIRNSQNVVLDGFYSHFAETGKKNLLKTALNNFLLANNLVKRYNNKAISHISSSGGYLQGVHLDMVRIGLLLYGYTPFRTKKISVQPIMKVYAPIIEKRTIKKGQSALYGNYPAKEDTDIALVRYGYADGLNRKQVKGQFNNRCMDVTAVIDGNESEWGYPVMIDANELALKYGTISYEVLTKVGIRAEKIYLR